MTNPTGDAAKPVPNTSDNMPTSTSPTNVELNRQISQITGVERDYAGCLNAMHEAEKGLTFPQRKRYAKELQLACSPEHGERLVIVMEECIRATARQRAEAFVATLTGEQP